MSFGGTTVHRPSTGDLDRVRVVPDGFRWSVFLLAPAALAARGLWLAMLGWFALVAAIVTLVSMGHLAPFAALLVMLVVDIILALDVSQLERRRLARRGWSTVAMLGPMGFVDFDDLRRADAGLTTGASVRPSTPSTDVIGLFPS